MRTASHCVRCINSILAGLDLRDVHLVGHSYGGSLAFQTAARAPARLASVTLVDPANTVARISGRFWRTAGAPPTSSLAFCSAGPVGMIKAHDH
jgi:pimeloyl-ACP methyl ester carboxylesterase